jgi:hypothetical protein
MSIQTMALIVLVLVGCGDESSPASSGIQELADKLAEARSCNQVFIVGQQPPELDDGDVCITDAGATEFIVGFEYELGTDGVCQVVIANDGFWWIEGDVVRRGKNLDEIGVTDLAEPACSERFPDAFP